MDDDFKDVRTAQVALLPASESLARTHWLDAYCMQAVDIIPGRYAVCFLRHPDGAKYSAIAASGISYSIDDELVSCCPELQDMHSCCSSCCMAACSHLTFPVQLYEPFYADFGPLNLGKTYRFCEHTKQLLQVRRAAENSA